MIGVLLFLFTPALSTQYSVYSFSFVFERTITLPTDSCGFIPSTHCVILFYSPPELEHGE